MLSFIIAMGFANMIGGRADDFFGEGRVSGRLIGRCILPAIMAAGLAYELGGSLYFVAYVCFAVGAGSALWFPWGWNFDEIDGKYSAFKYKLWIQKIGLYLVPLDNRATSNRLRGIIMKGLRSGVFDVLTFALLAPFDLWIFALWFGTFSMGFVYWMAGRILPAPYSVALGELMYGCLRAFLIGIAVLFAVGS